MKATPVLCRCGRSYFARTYPSGRNGVHHYECPACEVVSLRLVARLAVVLQDTPLGVLLLRMAAP